jgi:predicted DNA-binding transcriptional regulator YafY
MPFAKSEELLRLATIAASRHQGVHLNAIRDEFRCSKRTAQRMTEALTNIFPGVETHTDDERRKYWTLKDQRLSRLLRVKPDELAALKLAETSARNSNDKLSAGLLASLHDKIVALLPKGDAARIEADEEALLEAQGFAARPGPKAVTAPDVHEAVLAALKGPFHLSIHYRGGSTPEGSDRIVAPYGVLFGARRYLVAQRQDDPGGKFRHFRMDRIRSAEVLDETFAREPDFDLQKHARQAFGLFQSREEYGEVVWRFLPEVAENARDYEFHPEQTVEYQDDGSLIVRFQASGWLEMCWHLYMWGDQVEVLQPTKLKEMVKRFRRADFKGLP